ncbi:MAG: hypothetical protein ACM3QS_01795 [Bacteroidota bacterium]
MKTRLVTLLSIALLAAQASCAPNTTAVPGSVGFIEKVQGGVQAGPETAMVDVDPMMELGNADAMRVFNKGKANVNLGYGLGFTLYNDTVAGTTKVDLKGTSKQAALKLSQGGLKGYNPPGSITMVDLPNGATITILGTHYFITYYPSTKEAWVFNADGSVQFSISGGAFRNLPAASLVQIINGGTKFYNNVPFSVDDFDRFATQLSSPKQAVEELLKTAKITPTVTRKPPTATYTRKPSTNTPRPLPQPTTVTPPPPPPPSSNTPTMNFTRNAMCRSGPSQVYDAVTAFLDGQSTRIDGRNPDFNNTWWYVLIPDSGGEHCWVSLVTGIATGDLSNLPIIGSKPPPPVITITPVPPR